MGVFDSGVGGLSVTREIMALLPAQPIIYLADQVHAPYGERPMTEIRTLSEGITRFLLAEGAGVIVIACNTASAAALHGLRAQFPDVPFVGMEPAVKPAVEHTRSGQVGVIATAATFQGELFASLLDRYAGRVAIHTQICPELVPLVEAGELDSPHARKAVAQYLAPLLAAKIDQLVLGCTHYPFLCPLIEDVAGAGVAVIDPAPAVARQTGRVLAQRGWLAEAESYAGSRIKPRKPAPLPAHAPILHNRGPGPLRSHAMPSAWRESKRQAGRLAAGRHVAAGTITQFIRTSSGRRLESARR